MCNIESMERELSDALPLEIWEETVKQAQRSTLSRFKTGAVIFNPKTGEIVGRGCSHIAYENDIDTTHAEQHALRDSYGERNYGDNWANKSFGIVIASIGKAGNFTYSSRPCYRCAQALFPYKQAIEMVYYPERLNDGAWIVNAEAPVELMQRAKRSVSYIATHAKDMRIR